VSNNLLITVKKHLLSLAGLLLLAGPCLPAAAYAQLLPAVGLANTIPAQNVANQDIAATTITTATYRGQTFSMKRTPDSLLTGEATDRIERLEIQLAFCCNILFTDTLNPTCPPEREATIQATIEYIKLARPNWNPKAYRQELKFYLAEDKRRRQVYDY
jgi:hypothetical protein